MEAHSLGTHATRPIDDDIYGVLKIDKVQISMRIRRCIFCVAPCRALDDAHSVFLSGGY
jgi:hypothetical protein